MLSQYWWAPRLEYEVGTQLRVGTIPFIYVNANMRGRGKFNPARLLLMGSVLDPGKLQIDSMGKSSTQEAWASPGICPTDRFRRKGSQLEYPSLRQTFLKLLVFAWPETGQFTKIL
jgi:hypothetical protein